MRVIVVGCGRYGVELANRLHKRGHEVTVVDNSPTAFYKLPPDFQGRLVEGDALNQDVLHRAGIETADAIAVVTGRDELNMVVGYTAKKIYAIKNVIARNYNPNRRSLFEDFNLQTVSSSSWGAQRMEELLYHSEIRSVFSAGNGEVEIYELKIPEGCNGRELSEMFGEAECTVVAVSRAGKAVLPEPGMVLQTADFVLLSATFEGIETMRQRLCATQEEK